MKESPTSITLSGTFDLRPLGGVLDTWARHLGWNHHHVIHDPEGSPEALVEQALGTGEVQPESAAFFVIRVSDWCEPGNLPEKASAGDPKAKSSSPSQALAQRFVDQLRTRCSGRALPVRVLLAPVPEDAPLDRAVGACQTENYLLAALEGDESIRVARMPKGIDGPQGGEAPLPLFHQLAMVVSRALFEIAERRPGLIVIDDPETLWSPSSDSSSSRNPSAAT